MNTTPLKSPSPLPLDPCPAVAPESPASGPTPPGEPPPGGAPIIRVTGTVLVRDQYAPADTALRFENPDLVDLLSKPIPGLAHPILDFRETDVTVLDIDNHDAAVTREAVDAVIRSLRGWDVAHPTHRDGAHVFFKGPGNHERAVLAVLGVPQGLGVEIKRQARHPLAIHPDAPGATAGPPMIGPGPEAGDGSAGVVIDTQARDRWLAEHNMQVGGRYDHTHCPIDPGASSGQNPVAVYLDRVHCYLCSAQGRSLDGSPPGVFRFGSEGGVWQQLCAWAKVPVHWGHLQHVVTVLLPHVPAPIRREAYELALREVHGAQPALIARALNGCPDVVLLDSGQWALVRKAGIRPIAKPTEKLLSGLACCSYTADEAGLRPDPEKVARALLGIVDGYPLVRLVRPPVILPNPDPVTGVFLLADPSRKHIKLLDDPLPWNECCDALQKSFPGINPDALRAILGGVFCVIKHPGQPAMLGVQGPSGSGKTATAHLGAGILGESAEDMDISMEREKLSRCVGSACARGQRVFVSDEIDKERLVDHLGKLLRIGAQTTYRPLYSDGQVSVDSPLFLVLPCISLPCFLSDFDEVQRRLRTVRLRRKVPDWSATCGGSAQRWPDLTADNRRLANSILTHSYRLAVSMDFSWPRLADALEIGHLRDPEAEAARRVALAQLYEACRSPSTPRVTDAARYTAGDWIPLCAVHHLITECVDLGEDVTGRAQRRAIKTALESIDWNTVLGISEPDITCQVTSHGKTWVMRFIETGTLRGDERRNGALPPASLPATAESIPRA